LSWKLRQKWSELEAKTANEMSSCDKLLRSARTSALWHERETETAKTEDAETKTAGES
jgi:hypothetical protein